MAIEVSDVLERFLTNEFVVIVDIIMWSAKVAGLFIFIYAILSWRSLAVSRSVSPMMSQMVSSNASGGLIIGCFIASAFLWQFGEGISGFGELLWGTNSDFDTPYSSSVFDSVSQQSIDLINYQSFSDSNIGLHIGVRASFAIFSLFGLFSYFRGVLAITKLYNPHAAGKMTFGQIVVHIFFGIILIWSNYTYQSWSTTLTQSAS